VLFIEMSDVRALLRAERAARQDPPKAQRNHAPPSQIQNKKRKGGQEDRTDDEARKRPKEDEVLQRASVHDVVATADSVPLRPRPEDTVEPITAKVHTEAAPTNALADVDEDEWAAFERDVATPPPSPPKNTAISALQSGSAISAAPVTKEDLEAERRKEKQQAKRAQREEDLAAEKEDAARNLEEEFEEMDALEQRLKKLKEQRERLRVASTVKSDNGLVDEDAGRSPDDQPTKHEDIDDDESEDEDEDDAWVFGMR